MANAIDTSGFTTLKASINGVNKVDLYGSDTCGWMYGLTNKNFTAPYRTSSTNITVVGIDTYSASIGAESYYGLWANGGSRTFEIYAIWLE